MKLCEYGCGRKAIYSPIKGRPKWCCEDNYRKCPENRKKYGGNNGSLGKPHSEERKKKISKSLKGREVWNKDLKNIYSDDTLQKMKRSGGKHFKGKTYDEMYGEDKSLSMREKSANRMQKSMKGRQPWNNGLKTGPLSEEHKNKISKSNTGKKRSPECIKNIRIAVINRIRSRHGQCVPNYNPEACKLIDEYGRNNNYKFQHAENGGEFHIKELGYWVDGYDKDNNVVIEVDESFHFDINGNLSERDVIREKEITNFLDCKFIRLKIS